MEATPGIARPAVDDWLVERCGLTGPFELELIAGGRSNLTYRVRCGDGRSVVLRRPPTGNVLPSAHDMGREHRVIAALHGSTVPVAEPLGFCADHGVTGADFYVMAEVSGQVLRDEDAALTGLDVDGRRRATESLVDVLVALHAIEPDDVGLGDLGRREAYVERQLRRWHGQWDQSKTRELPVVDEVHARLAAGVPEQRGASIAHGDYRLDNVMVDDRGTVVAVFDWEICTLGDPLADLGVLLTYWGQAGDDFLALPSTPTVAPGFPTRAEVADRYLTAAGLPDDDLAFYVAFGNWKLACILEGVYARYVAGVMGDTPDELDDYAARVEQLAERARAILDGGEI
ncbi:MAG: phosphotransferase family protein [Actinomycetota bacterium]